MSITSDVKFKNQLKLYLNESDVETILTSFNKPIECCNINRRTGRTIIGAPSKRPRRLLTKGSLINYKSVILKFAKFKASRIGREAPIDAEIAKKYDDEILANSNKKHQTILTNLRILNKNIFSPLLNQEIQPPRNIHYRTGFNLFSSNADESFLYINKAQLTHEEVAQTLKYLWERCRNRDHVYKCILIYYSGLRHSEADNLTFKDILDGWSEKGIVIIVRRGKGKTNRHVLLFKGTPTIFFEKYLIPYLNTKMMKELHSNNNNNDDVLNKKIFSNSSYQSVQKEFKKALKHVVRKQNYNSNNISKIIKGAGIHSIRADYSTRTLRILCKMTRNIPIAMRTAGFLLGHKSEKIVYRHYINLGYNLRSLKTVDDLLSLAENNNNDDDDNNDNNNNNNMITEEDDENYDDDDDDDNNDNEREELMYLSDINANNSFSFSNDENVNILSNFSTGSIANRLFDNDRKHHSNINNFTSIYENVAIFNMNSGNNNDGGGGGGGDNNNRNILNHISII